MCATGSCLEDDVCFAGVEDDDDGEEEVDEVEASRFDVRRHHGLLSGQLATLVQCNARRLLSSGSSLRLLGPGFWIEPRLNQG